MPTMRRLAALLFAVSVAAPAWAEPVTVFAAASLKPVLDVVLADAPVEVRAVYAGSSALARQIEAGAPADIFLSASPEWMDYLAERGFLDTTSRRDVARNRLVLVGPPGAPKVEAGDLGDLADERIAVALTDAVPSGVYAKAALTYLGAWDALRPALVETQDVRAALRLAATGATPGAIVYASDAASEPGVEVRLVFPETSHPAIVYPAALTAGAAADAAAVLDHVTNARDAFTSAGFLPVAGE